MAEGEGKHQLQKTVPDGGEAPVSGAPAAAALAPGLHFVATPIGTARDITLRALDTLRHADVIAAEDTRNTRRLMEIHGIPVGGRPLLPYHDHNGAEMRPRLIRALTEGKRVAYVSDAGTPLVADPGYQLARAAIDAGLPVTAAPGPSAALAALTLSGLPSDRFMFAGFPPPQAGARKTWIAGLDASGATVILFESPKRIKRLLGELCDALGETRQAALCRELTKRFEEVRRGTLDELRDSVTEHPPKGEIVLVLDRAGDVEIGEADLDAALHEALGRLRVKDAAAEVAARLGLPKRDVYQRALVLKGED